ncbi:hypothetical protein ATE48_09490 [Candidatus Viadribacter manganicus]|uniref:Uncharacterized protein n=1 Tax=Candidatus Viadribacter manganicus TaxID=1759059 RepID=A0A1B1AHU9_9PROT|nr:hypothetical protein ATE48_09490 [Candidatus Viadribacter manganicus]
MRPRQSSPISDLRLARFVAWLSALLAWVALGAPKRSPSEQRRGSRYGGVTITRLRHAVRHIIILHAAKLLPRRPRHVWRNFALSGLRCRKGRCTQRVAAGVWLRRRLNVKAARSRKCFIFSRSCAIATQSPRRSPRVGAVDLRVFSRCA